MRTVKITLLFIVILIGSNTDCDADTKIGRSSNGLEAEDFRENLILFNLHAGFLTGDAADIIDALDDNPAEKILYGYGLSYERFLNLRTSIGINFEYLIKGIPESDGVSLKGKLFALNGSYYLTELKRSRPFLKVEYGRLNTSVGGIPLYNYDFDPVSFFKIGLGLTSSTGKSTATRFELYYRKILSKDIDTNYGEMPFDITHIGMTFGLAIPF